MIVFYVELDVLFVKFLMWVVFFFDGEFYMGGVSDGNVYELMFVGWSFEDIYDMICIFLQEEGYKDVLLFVDVIELQVFQFFIRNWQVFLFEDNGYVYNLVKILFLMDW